jgi:hypothetical protein
MANDWTKIQQKYKGLWVALADDEETVLASGKTLLEARKEASKKGHDDPIFTRMPETLTAYVGVWQA